MPWDLQNDTGDMNRVLNGPMARRMFLFEVCKLRGKSTKWPVPSLGPYFTKIYKQHDGYLPLCSGSFFRTFLLVSEDEVDPLVDLAGDELRLERLPVHPHELVRRRRPRRQLHVVHQPRRVGGVLQAPQLHQG